MVGELRVKATAAILSTPHPICQVWDKSLGWIGGVLQRSTMTLAANYDDNCTWQPKRAGGTTCSSLIMLRAMLKWLESRE